MGSEMCIRDSYTSLRNHPAFKVLHKLPKYSDEAIAHSIGNQVANDNVEEDDGDGSEDETPQDTPSLTEHTAQYGASSTNSSPSAAKDRSQRPRGKKSSLRLRAEEEMWRKVLENAREISTSLKRRNEHAEEKIALFACRKEE